MLQSFTFLECVVVPLCHTTHELQKYIEVYHKYCESDDDSDDGNDDCVDSIWILFDAMMNADILALAGLRADGRTSSEIRRNQHKIGFHSEADGSSYLELGLNKVNVLVFGPQEPRRKSADIGSDKVRILPPTLSMWTYMSSYSTACYPFILIDEYLLAVFSVLLSVGYRIFPSVEMIGSEDDKWVRFFFYFTAIELNSLCFWLRISDGLISLSLSMRCALVLV